ncbi:MAG: hypothetical protein CVV49_02490 [Spirochaetae bacterium HGW-Spirochaetae-5]|nr:MAG: hypothetical protein CVV49_02490 [Spirochaetae bacterium HGW-Spirochaetae-5]
MDQKLVSIAMATYNGAAYLKLQLDSIIAQTYKNIEIIICDDCSSDGTVKILEEYCLNRNIRYYVNEKNLGYIKNFEKVLGYCSGDFIALADQDDIWLENKVEFLVNNIGDSTLIFSDSCLIDEQGELLAKSYLKHQNIDIPGSAGQLNRLMFCNYVTGCTVLFKRDILEKAFPFIDTISHDWWIALHASINGGIASVNTPLVLYRQHPGNTIGAEKFNIRKIFRIIRKVNTRRLKVINECDRLCRISECLKSRYENFKDLDRVAEIERDLFIYRKSLMKKTPLHLNAFLIAWKYRKCWFDNHPEICALAKLIV